MREEVLPYNPDAWADSGKTKVGYEIPLLVYFMSTSLLSRPMILPAHVWPVNTA